MSSGKTSVLMNTRERVLSTDFNLQQQLQDNDVAELLRGLLSTEIQTVDSDYNYETETDTIGTPLECHIVKGLCIDPVVGTDRIDITGGLALVVDPDGAVGSSDPAAADPNDNVLKWCRSAGLSGVGVGLDLSDNTSGSIRIDIIEMRRQPNIAVVTDNRDVFNTTTGAFSAVSVDKVTKSDIEFRIREGVPGAGIPAHAAGWCPIAVASVPDGSTTPTIVDSTTFWDVRPLISDRWNAPFNQGEENVPLSIQNAIVDDVTSYGVAHPMSGFIKSRYGAYRAGGKLRSGVPGTGNTDSIDIYDVRNQDGAAHTNYYPWYLWTLFPARLPRWVRFEEPGGATRVPGPFRGIPVVCQIYPDTLTNSGPAVAIALPAITGLSTTTSYGVCLFAGPTSNTGVYQGANAKEGLILFDQQSLGAATGAAATSPILQFYWVLITGTAGGIPPNARSLIMDFAIKIAEPTVTSGIGFQGIFVSTTGLAFLSTISNNILHLRHENVSGVAAGSNQCYVNFTMEVPIHEDYPIGSHPAPSIAGRPNQRVVINLQMTPGTANWTITSSEAFIRGWRLGGQ